MKSTTITTKESRHLYELINHPSSRPTEDTVGPPHNPTGRTTAHVTVNSDLYIYLNRHGWLEDGTVLVSHSPECSDEFRIQKRVGFIGTSKWTVSHMAVR